MKKGIVVGIAGVVGAILLAFVYFACTALRLDSEGRQYADAAISAIISRWDVREYEDRARGFRASVDRPPLKAFFTKCRKLGKLKKYYGSQGRATVSVRAGTGTAITGSYTARADFEGGPATITLRLIKVDNRWFIKGITVNADVLWR